MPSDKKELALLMGQILSIMFLFFTGPLFIHNIPFLLMQIFGMLLIAWAIMAKRLNKTEAAHLPKGYFFITKGPYEIIRHPVYAGMLLTMAGFVQGYSSFSRFLVFAVLIMITLLKIIFEEHFMEKNVKEYAAFKTKTHRLIPYFY